MKPVVKQKLSTLQDIINNAQSGGGGGTVDAYTKAEADAKFETKTDAASTYLSKSDAASTYLPKTDAANMQRKIISMLSKTTEGETIFMQATISDFNSLNDLDGATLIFDVHGGGFPEIYLTKIFYSFIMDNNLKIFDYSGRETQENIPITLSNNILTIKFDISDADFDFISGKLAVIF